MLGIELTEKQKKIWSEMGDQLIASIDIQHLALQYYIQYREHLQKNKLMSDDTDKISNLIHIAYFISEKNQLTYNVRGQRVVGIALSINQIIKKNNNFQDFIFHMKEMLKIITIEDKFVQQQIQTCLKKFKFSMTFHHKFLSTFRKIKPINNNFQLCQSLLWLIFILAKQSIPMQNQYDIIQITCLIASVFMFYVQESIKNSGKDYELDDANYGGVLRKQTVTHVFLEYFRLKDMSKFQQVSYFFRNQINQLKQMTGYQLFFHDRVIQNSYRKIDSIYMKKLNQTTLDQRHFLKQRINTVLNANRFTPFGGRKNTQRFSNIPMANQVLSHRVLNYQKQQQQRLRPVQNQNEQANENFQKNTSTLLKRLVQNKTPAQKTPLIKATPMTNAMQTYNWVLQKSNYHKFDHSQLFKYVKVDEKTLKLINGLWKDICLNEVDKGLQLSQVQKSVIFILACEIVYFVLNSNENIEKLVNQFQMKWYDVWSKIDCVLSYDNRMPISIKLHLLSLDTLLISKQLWKKEQNQTFIFRDAKARSDKSEIDRLYKRSIHQIAYQTYFLSKKLGLNELSINSIFLLCQYVITQHTELLVNRSIYHMLLCSIYAVSKAQQLQISFFTILIGFKQLNNFEKEDYQQLTEQIYAYDDNKEVVKKDIISFYNEQFVKKITNLLVQFKYQSNSAIKSLSNKKNIISSPVKELLPRNVVALGDRTNKTPIHTPTTLALQAYHQSPLLRERRIKNLANCIDGKRILQKKGQFIKQQSLKQTSMLINQKWRHTKSPEQKLNTTVKKGNQNL